MILDFFSNISLFFCHCVCDKLCLSVLTIGFEQSEYVVSESAGSFQPCLLISAPAGGVSDGIVATLTVTAMDGTAVCK